MWFAYAFAFYPLIKRAAGDFGPQLVKIIFIEAVIGADEGDGIFPLIELQGHPIDLIVLWIVCHDVALKILGVEDDRIGDVTGKLSEIGASAGDSIFVQIIGGRARVQIKNRIRKRVGGRKNFKSIALSRTGRGNSRE